MTGPVPARLVRAAADGSVRITADDAGWRYTGLSVLTLAAGEERRIETGDSEVFVLPLAGSVRVGVEPDGAVFDLQGRDTVFARVTDFAYVGRDSTLTLTGDGATVALPSARCERRLPPAYGPAEQVPVETRGAGVATRQVNNFGIPGVWDHADKLVCCELLTPDGNWSSYPPHKHDASAPCRVINEEIYLYRIADSGFGYHRTYTTDEHLAAGLAPIDDAFEVRDLDTVLVPHGYHGPSIAAPGYPMYYLNVMAGPADERALAFCDDPAHTWIRDSWAGQPLDPRCPMTSSDGPIARNP